MSDTPTTIPALHHEMVLEFRHLDEKVDEVKVLAEQTNGRVRSLELWRAFLGGATALLGVAVASGAAWVAVLSRSG